jgi:hypothetical protein
MTEQEQYENNINDNELRMDIAGSIRYIGEVNGESSYILTSFGRTLQSNDTHDLVDNHIHRMVFGTSS